MPNLDQLFFLTTPVINPRQSFITGQELLDLIAAVTETDPVVGAIDGVVKADGAGNISAAVPGTDYLAVSQFSSVDSVTWTEDFEDQDESDWSVTNATVADNADAQVGSYSGLFTATGSAAGDVAEYSLPENFWKNAAVPGRRVRIQFWYKRPGSNASNNVRLELTNGTDTDAVNIIPTSSWQTTGFIFTPTVVGTELTLKVYPDRDGTDEAVLLDNITAFIVPDIITSSNIDQWIGSTAIGTAYIGDAQITTLKIDGNAVSVPQSAQQTSDYDSLSADGGTWVELFSFTYTAGGGALTATFSGSVRNMNVGPGGTPLADTIADVRVVIDGDNGPANSVAAASLSDGGYYQAIVSGHRKSPVTGSVTVKVETRDQVGSMRYMNGLLLALETKR